MGTPDSIRNATLLCVDDEEIPRALRALVLKKQGYEVVAASSGKEALQMLSERTFDLVLTDQMMPGMLGTELARKIKEQHPAIPVVLVSGVNELPPDIAFADLFISKIQGPQALFDGVATMLEKSRQS